MLYDCLYPESLGGVEHRNLELGRELAARGHAVTLAGYGGEPGSPAPGVQRLLLGPARRLHDEHGRRRATDAMAFAAASARLDLGAFSAVETASIPFAHLPGLALRCRAARIPLLVSWYEYWGRYWRTYSRSPTWPLFAACERLCAHLGRLAIADSQLTAARLARRRGGGVPVVPVGIRAAAIAAAAADAPAGAPLIYSGRLIPEKRLDLLLRAAARLASGWSRRSKGPLLDIVGEGPDLPRLERLAGELGLAGSLRFRGRLPEASDVWRALGGARVAVQPSAREGFGLFPLEAMAAGLPVVFCASSESAVAELVETGCEGIGVAPDPEALAAALGSLLDDDGLRRRLGEQARLKAARYDWAVVGSIFESHLLRLAPC